VTTSLSSLLAADGVAVFAEIADQLLCQAELVIAGEPHRLREIEFYYTSSEHPDPYTHQHVEQQQADAWYLHRSGKGFRSGSFKGIDIAVGSDGSCGGILIRSVETSSGDLINGPSLCVDHILRLTSQTDPSSLHQRLQGHNVWTTDSVLFLRRADRNLGRVSASARVGLAPPSDSLDFMFRPYRFLRDARSISKGRVCFAVEWLRQGVSVSEIVMASGAANNAVRRYAKAFEEGLAAARTPRSEWRRPVVYCRLAGEAAAQSDADAILHCES
jgi:hypothetical protein